jgi:hypothetical protein
MLLALIAIALVAVASFGLGLCRLAALSDHSHDVALAEWMAVNQPPAQETATAQRPSAQTPSDPSVEVFRAAG